MSGPRGLPGLLTSATAGGWRWTALSHLGPIKRGANIGHKRVTVTEQARKTVLVAGRGPRTLMTWWADGKHRQSWTRHADDPCPVPVGARALAALIGNDPEPDTGPRWTRPDLGDDER